MLKMKQVIFDLSCKLEKLLFMVMFCLAIISIVSSKRIPHGIATPIEEALVDFALDHNQCLGEGHGPESFEYNKCMEKLQIQRKSIVKI